VSAYKYDTAAGVEKHKRLSLKAPAVSGFHPCKTAIFKAHYYWVLA
jgi:hypothetical protein